VALVENLSPFRARSCRCVVNDIDQKSAEMVSRELESFGTKSSDLRDVSLKSSVEEMVSRIIKEWNKIDILVNCAGIARITRS